jgi:tetratricopeptide (TPR) repeat protein
LDEYGTDGEVGKDRVREHTELSQGYEATLSRGKDSFLSAITAYSKYLDSMGAVRKNNLELAKYNKSLGKEESNDDAVYDEILGLKRKINDLEKQSEILRERCETYFRKSIDNYEGYEKRMGVPESCVEFFRNWGTSVYAQAVIKMDMMFYNDAKRLFRNAVEIYDSIECKDDEIHRRMGNAYYEAAAVAMNSCLYDEAKVSFMKAKEQYENVEIKNIRDRRRLGNTLFELGRLDIEMFLLRREVEDDLYKKAIKAEAAGGTGLGWADEVLSGCFDGCYIYAESDECHDEFGIETLFDAEPESVGALIKKCGELFYGAINEYTLIGDEKIKNEKYVDVFRSWGEVHSLLGRLYRYKYLTILQKVEDLVGVENLDENEHGHLIRQLRASACSAAKHFIRAEKRFRDAKYLDEENEDSEETWIVLGAAHYRLFLTLRYGEGADLRVSEYMREEAANIFRDSKSTVLDIFVALGDDVCYPLMSDKTLYPLLDLGNANDKDAEFFGNVVGEAGEAIDKYKEVYIRSMYIISRLEVKSENGKVVAHYTTKPVSQHMIFRGKKFGLYASRYFNDPDEGEILLDYLFDRKSTKRGKVKLRDERLEYVTFAGSFSFDYDSLNLFRLYGREGGREGTGLSLVFHRTFFREELKQDRAAYLEEIKGDVVGRKGEEWWSNFVSKLGCQERRQRKNVLFRCVYFDPETDDVETVGQKERSLFYREKKAGDYKKYKKFIDNVVVDVKKELKALKAFVAGNRGLDKNVIAQLTLKLRFLIKHVNFKEEQECRIVKNRRITGDRIDDDGQDTGEGILIGSEENTLTEDLKMHLEYNMDVAQHVKEIYFGPKTSETGIEMFKKCLINRGLGKIVCKKSLTHLA